ncbi:MAG TPA: 2'-5' RNA ligase family protein [Cyclobacteriaceae bacterium]|nr:2'-5' RNA ligase family protein [Cyclobacteriaceae bacterium]
MKLSSINLRQSVKELFFIIAPPPHIMSDVSVLKDDVQYLIGKKFDDRFSKAHISLFKYDDRHMDDLVKFVELKAMDFKPFNVFLKDFGVFYAGSKRSIYMDIVNKYPIQEIFENTVKEDPDFTPHLAIARNLSDEEFLKCWPYLKSLHYSQHFTCDRITVLARFDKRWVHYRDIEFGQ